MIIGAKVGEIFNTDNMGQIQITKIVNDPNHYGDTVELEFTRLDTGEAHNYKNSDVYDAIKHIKDIAVLHNF
jgi:hypothetical protein